MDLSENFGAVDYVVFVLILLISVLIGVYQGFKKQLAAFFAAYIKHDKVESFELDNAKNDEVENSDEKLNDYLVANSTIGPLPIAFSLLATFFSATSIIGIPSEVYSYGIQYWIICFGMIINPVIGAFATGPFLAKFNLQSVFEYLELRYNSKLVRLLGTTCYVIRMFISTAVYIYGPASSLSTFTNVSDIYAIAIIGVVATLYTTIGGIRGVIFTDAFQITMMFAGLFAIIIKGLIDLGGFRNLWTINSANHRLNLFDFNPDPFIRQSFWPLFFGNALGSLMSYGIDQQMLQRFKASNSKRTAQIALLLNVPGMFILISLCCLVGLILFAIYARCDPLTAPEINLVNPNKLVGYYVLTSLNKVAPGMAGLFLASLFSASMSSVSSTLNSMSSIIMHDYIRMFERFKRLSDRDNLRLIKTIVAVCGIFSTAIAFLLTTIGGNLVQISASLNGAFISPIIGLFLLACLFSFTNSKGAITGTIFGFFCGCWISFGASIVKPTYPKLPVSLDGCLNSTSSSPFDFFSSEHLLRNQPADTITGFKKFYTLSYMWYTAFGVLGTLIVGILVSLATGGLKQSESLQAKYVLYDLSFCCNAAGRRRREEINVQADDETKRNETTTNQHANKRAQHTS